MEDLVTVRIHGKAVKIPREMKKNGRKLSARAFAVETGQATWAEMNGEELPEGMRATADNPVEAAMIAAGKTTKDIFSNIKQAGSELFGNQQAAEAEKAKQREANRLSQSVTSDFPVSSFVGSALPYFAVPGGKGVQIGAGAIQGALEGDTLAERIGGAALGAGLAFGGQKLGDKLGAKLQNKLQTVRGNPNAAARGALLDAGVPLTLSQRTDSPISKPLARFFERGRFVLTGHPPKGAAQQSKLTELVTDSLGMRAKKLTRQALGDAVTKNKLVFQGAANRVSGNLMPDQTMTNQANRLIQEFADVGTDSPQVAKIFSNFEDFASNPNGITPKKYLHLRSQLSEATTKSDIETSVIVDAIKAMDERLAREVPDLADDLMIARDRFRLLLALRRGSALSPQGDINVQTFTKNLERVFRDFDAGKPLPRGLKDAGEAIAGFSQVTDPFRTSATAENLASIGGPGMSAAADPSAVLKFLMGSSAPFAGGGTGGLLGGGTGRTLAQSLLEAENGR